MAQQLTIPGGLSDDVELREWLDSLDYVIQQGDPERVRDLLLHLRIRAQEAGIDPPAPANTPYANTLSSVNQPAYPGDLHLEQRIEAYSRWNAAVTVVKANREHEGIGGHLSSYASCATLYEVGFNHFFRGPGEGHGGDQVFFQGHSSPGIYARAFVEGRLTEGQLERFRRETLKESGLPSYPHPWLMPRFWQFPTVSMGLGPLMAAYQARFNRYLERRGLKDTSGSRVWAFLGDGETDEPESLAAIRMAARENLDNLTFVINCNLQRLDGPVRGNGKIVQELEGIFRGAGWNVIKVLWSSAWDSIFARDTEGLLIKRLGDMVDGAYQKCIVEGGAYMREHLFDTPYLKSLVAHLSDQELEELWPGGLDREKVYAAYLAATEHKGQPTVILAHTIKGFQLGPNLQARNVTHDRKALADEELTVLRTKLGLPIPDEDIPSLPFVRPAEQDPAVVYLKEHRDALGGYLPQRKPLPEPIPELDDEPFSEFAAGNSRPVSTTMVMARVLSNLLRHKEIGPKIVPIIPDEARTFGLEGLFRQVGIYAPHGQLYDPVDSKTLLPYREATDGQILEEGITEAGGMASFIAAGTSGNTQGALTIPFYWFYSKFGLQRIGDLAWAAGEMRTRGFMVGGLSGRTELQGEGLQHQDGESHLLSYPIPNLKSYDPAYAFEIAAIVKHGIKEMFVDQKDVFYYLTVGNENYEQLPMPKHATEEAILRGLYLFRPAEGSGTYRAQLFGSGAIMNEVLEAQKMLSDRYGVAADVWSVTSYKALWRDCSEAARATTWHPDKKPSVPYVVEALKGHEGPIVAASDYTKALPDSLAAWLPAPLTSLGTDGFGRSGTRPDLRDHFEVDSRYIVFATLSALNRNGNFPLKDLKKAVRELEIDTDRINPVLR